MDVTIVMFMHNVYHNLGVFVALTLSNVYFSLGTNAYH